MRRLASTTIALMALLLAMLAVAPGVSAQATVDPECGCFVGYATVRSSIEVGQDGQSFAGIYTFEPLAGMAEAMGLPVGQLGPGEVTGQRIAVEPMGEPVGPLPEEEPVE
jgi:hypothetical protein